jgi:hypothetical protein
MSWFYFFTGFLFYFYWIVSFFYSAHSLLFAGFDTEQKIYKNNPTKMVLRTRRTHRTKASNTKTRTRTRTNTNIKPTPSKKAKTTKTAMTEMKKGGRHPGDDSFWDHFGDLCKFIGYEGMVKVKVP